MFEFYNVFDIPSSWQNKEIKVTIKCFDVYNHFINGTGEEFYLNSNKPNIANLG